MVCESEQTAGNILRRIIFSKAIKLGACQSFLLGSKKQRFKTLTVTPEKLFFYSIFLVYSFWQRASTHATVQGVVRTFATFHQRIAWDAHLHVRTRARLLSTIQGKIQIVRKGKWSKFVGIACSITIWVNGKLLSLLRGGSSVVDLIN